MKKWTLAFALLVAFGLLAPSGTAGIPLGEAPAEEAGIANVPLRPIQADGGHRCNGKILYSEEGVSYGLDSSAEASASAIIYYRGCWDCEEVHRCFVNFYYEAGLLHMEMECPYQDMGETVNPPKEVPKYNLSPMPCPVREGTPIAGEPPVGQKNS